MTTNVTRNRRAERHDQQVIDLTFAPIADYRGKRVFDIVVGCFVAILVLSWLLPLIGLAIRLTSPGPALFVQIRSGRNGRQFRCFKFRTMYMPLPDQNPFMQTSQSDPRVTRLGRLLRRTNLDEMPQFLNVLLGDMSLVGPRPHPIELDAQYWYTLPGYQARYGLRPGITGLAQVSKCRGNVTSSLMMKHRVDYDRFYIRHASVRFDLLICLKTLKAMFTGNTDAF